MNFFLDIVSEDKCPKYNGCCYRLSNDKGLSLRHKTKIIYIHLLDMVPAKPATLQRSMTQAKKLSFEHGQRFPIYTCDQHLHCIAASILWHNTELPKDFYLQLGCMHFRMSYIGSIRAFRVLMEEVSRPLLKVGEINHTVNLQMY